MPSPAIRPWEELKAEVPLVDFLTTQGLQIRRVGAGLKALCPFHKPRGQEAISLAVYPRTGDWFCKSCGRRGDALDFLICATPWLTRVQALQRLHQWRVDEDERLFGPRNQP